MAATSAVHARRRARARSHAKQRLAVLCAAVPAVVLLVGWLFAGSPARLAGGTRIAGVDVGGLTTRDARTLLERRAARLQNVPVRFTAGGRSFALTPDDLDVHVDWAAAVAAARQSGGGFGPMRGYRRLELQLFPQDVQPPIRAYGAALAYELRRIAAAVDRPHRDARLVRRGLHVTIQAGRTGRVLDTAGARRLVVDALASFSRAPVALPVRSDPPSVGVASLLAAQRAAARVVAAPVTLVAGPTRLRLARWRLAKMLVLPRTPTDGLRFGGPQADAYFAAVARTVGRAPRNADWVVDARGAVHVKPSSPGVTVDVPVTARAVLSAAERASNRVACVAVTTQQPARTTAQAQALAITGTVATYETFYGGDPNRIHNVQLVARLIDRKLIAPGATFSFNATTGERTAAKGFRVAPVIVNGELQNGLGGGVCQVSTTVFNAAYEAGLPITARTNHALYISHYPLGRDATVDYPDVDLKFVNDTGHWLLLRTFVGPDSLTVGLYGTPQHRRVVSVAQPLTVVAPPPVQKTVDATLAPGEVVVDDPGEPATKTSVERKVYGANGRLLSDQTFYSSYRALPKLIRVGPPKAQAKPAKPKTVTQPAAAPAGPH
ncbi:MAG TPA: VanW family protein [Gaiellaceae bacterium]|nr:VanW family protein [Gaiellaceae bacterium]